MRGGSSGLGILRDGEGGGVSEARMREGRRGKNGRRGPRPVSSEKPMSSCSCPTDSAI